MSDAADCTPCTPCTSAWHSIWTLSGPDPWEGNSGAEKRSELKWAWAEHFYTLDALCARIIALKRGSSAPAVNGPAPAEASQSETDLLDKFREGDKLTDDEKRHLKKLQLAEPTKLLVTGPLDAAPIKWPLHPVVCARVRALSPGPSPTSQPAGASTNIVATSSNPILVKEVEARALINAMLRRPLILLAGVSGSGKTQLAKRLGKAWAAGAFHPGGAADPSVDGVLRELKRLRLVVEDTDGWWKVFDIESAPGLDRRYAFTAVRSDWNEASHLWGYHVPLPAEAEGFYGTDTLRVFLHAHKEYQQKRLDLPHFVLLDEMNLSRPEHFASDLLSAMEVQLGTDARAEVIELHKGGNEVKLRTGESGSEQVVPQRIGWAPGLRVIGTVNVDETTFSFAPKVLDRAALLEFVDVDLKFVFSGSRYEGGTYDTEYMNNQAWFTAVNKVLAPHNLHIAYRAAAEILKALKLAGTPQGQSELDRQLCHKILPRIRGPRAQVEPILKELREKVCKANWVVDKAEDALSSGRLPGGTSGIYPISIKKIDQMLLRAYTTGFTSYFG